MDPFNASQDRRSPSNQGDDERSVEAGTNLANDLSSLKEKREI